MKLLDEELEYWGRINYSRYCELVGNKTWDDRPCPTWEQLTDKIRMAWCGSAQTVREKFLASLKPQ